MFFEELFDNSNLPLNTFRCEVQIRNMYIINYIRFESWTYSYLVRIQSYMRSFYFFLHVCFLNFSTCRHRSLVMYLSMTRSGNLFLYWFINQHNFHLLPILVWKVQFKQLKINKKIPSALKCTTLKFLVDIHSQANSHGCS